MGFTLRPVRGEGFVNRAELLEEMVSELKDSKSTLGYALYGRRRLGKTSILKELGRRLENEEKIAVVYFSVWDLIEFTVEEFCQRLSIEIIDAYRPYLGLKYRGGELLQTPLVMLRKILDKSELKVVYNEVEFLLSFKDGRMDVGEIIERTFNLSERFAEKTGAKCVLLLDEFPSIVDLKTGSARVGEAILKKVRTIFEGWDRTALCVSGSIRSTMRIAVLSPTSPFYRQLVVKEVKPFEKAFVRELLLLNLDISEEGVEEVYNFSAGVPFYIQFIGKMLGRGDKVTLDLIKGIEVEFLAEEGNILFKEEFDALSPKERLIVMNLADERHTPKEMAEVLRDKVSNMNRFLGYLIEKGIVSRREKGFYVLEDPVFKRWLKEKRYGLYNGRG